MVKVEDIKTPKTIEEFRSNLKKYCLGENDNIFIYSRINKKRYKVEVNQLSKLSDAFKLIKDDSVLSFTAMECNIVLMCDISKISVEALMMNQEEAIKSLKESYLFNNQDTEERRNFLNSTPYAIDRIVSGKKVIDEVDTKPKQTAINLNIFSGLYFHLFGKYFDTVDAAKIQYNLSKYN